MRICFDLDGVICSLRKEGETYADVVPLPGAKEKLSALKAAGHTIIINTARHMKTCNGNVGQVLARLGQVTFDWLRKHEIPFDEIYFGKPSAEIYIDDLAYRFSSWENIASDGSNLPVSEENEKAVLSAKK
jgi:capsule biosynthesis phosphatase